MPFHGDFDFLFFFFFCYILAAAGKLCIRRKLGISIKRTLFAENTYSFAAGTRRNKTWRSYMKIEKSVDSLPKANSYGINPDGRTFKVLEPDNQ